MAKIARRETSLPPARPGWSIPGKVYTDFQAYQEFYKKTYGQEIRESELAEEMLKTFMAEDKDFQKFCKERNPAPALANA